MFVIVLIANILIWPLWLAIYNIFSFGQMGKV